MESVTEKGFCVRSLNDDKRRLASSCPSFRLHEITWLHWTDFYEI